MGAFFEGKKAPEKRTRLTFFCLFYSTAALGITKYFRWICQKGREFQRIHKICDLWVKLSRGAFWLRETQITKNLN